jgi:hypothetical protein
MMRAAARTLRAAASRGSPTLGRARHLAEPSGAARAAPELELLKLQLALEDKKAALAIALEDKKAALAIALEKEKAALAIALEDKKAAQAIALEKEKAALAIALEKEKAAQGRGLWETVLGVKRETAQLLNLAAGGAFFIASGTYLTSAMMHDTWARTQVALSKSEAASQDVRAFMTNAQRA